VFQFSKVLDRGPLDNEISPSRTGYGQAGDEMLHEFLPCPPGHVEPVEECRRYLGYQFEDAIAQMLCFNTTNA